MASCPYFFRPGPATEQAVPASVAVVVVLEREAHGARLHSGAAVAPVAASVEPLAEVLVYVPHSVVAAVPVDAAAVLVVEVLGARVRSDAAVAASVAPLADAARFAGLAVAAALCAAVDCAELAVAVAVAVLLSAPVAVLVSLLVLPGLAAVVELLPRHAQRFAVESEPVSVAAAVAAVAAARAVAFADVHLYCLERPRRLSWPFAVCVLRLSLVQPDLMFEVPPPVAHP